MKKMFNLFILMMLVLSFSCPIILSDGGMIGPPQIHIYERAQNAIVAWNGSEEVLIISIDVDSSVSTKALRIIPLPSNPIEVKEGSFDSFTTLQDIINKKLSEMYNNSYRLSKSDGSSSNLDKSPPPSNVEVTFQDEIGAHNITIFHILDNLNFSNYATDFAKSAGLTNVNFSSKFQQSIEDYLDINISYFVFDIINISEDEQSLNPIVYRFKSDFLYYPLKITGASDVGETYANVNVFCIAKNRIKNEIFSDLSFYSNIKYSYYYNDLFNNLNFSEDEIKEISEDIYDIFKGDPLIMSYSYYGKYSNIEDDIIVNKHDFADPNIDIEIPDFEFLTGDIIYLERGSTTLLNVTIENTGNTKLRLQRLKIEGGLDWIQSNWYSITPNYFYDDLDIGEKTTFEILFKIPSNIALGDYKFNISIDESNYDVENKKTMTMTIFDKTEPSSSFIDISDIKNILTNLTIIAILFMFLISIFLIIFIAILLKKINI